MTISLLEPLMCGNAVRVFIDPPRRALFWRLLRRTADVFTGQDDAGAVVVADNCTDNVWLDTKALVNGTAYFWRLYSWDGASWTASDSATATPAASYEGDDCDPQQVVRDRIEAGLRVEIERGNLLPESGKIPVLKGPFQVADKVVFPTVFVHHDQTAPADRALGEDVAGLDHLDDGDWFESEGWLARTNLNIGMVSTNLDERNALRRAVVRVLQANLGVFAAAGMSLIECSLSDSEDLEAKGVPLFLSGGSFS
ncbi:MAG TPA: hypothetical protein VGC15_16565, partial [Acetobacteraceae bacterium]